MDSERLDEIGLYYDPNTGSYHCCCRVMAHSADKADEEVGLDAEVAQLLRDWRQLHAKMAVCFEVEPLE